MCNATNSTSPADRDPPMGSPLCCCKATMSPLLLCTVKSRLMETSQSITASTTSTLNSQKCKENDGPSRSSLRLSFDIANDNARRRVCCSEAIQYSAAGRTRGCGVLRKQSSTSYSIIAAGLSILRKAMRKSREPECSSQSGESESVAELGFEHTALLGRPHGQRDQGWGHWGEDGVG